ncbi:MAG: TonB-dependent receptor, partial [Telluria sp.]
MPVRFTTPLVLLSLLPAAALAQSITAADPSTDLAANKPAAKEASAKKDGKITTVEVKGAASDYDPRRDDTASKTVMNADEIRKYGDDNIYDVLKR